MFIIFDLDDTLIDTSGSITPLQLKKALETAIHFGLPVEDFSAAYEKLLEVNHKARNGEGALRSYLDSWGASIEIIDCCVDVLRSIPGPEVSIRAIQHAKEVLEALRHHRLAIVTVGNKDLQLYKLEKAGLDPHLFSKIVVTVEKDKGSHYKALLDEFKANPFETVVVGDRIPVDLSPAKALGCQTVQLLWGRGLIGDASDALEDVDHRIQDLNALVDIIDHQKVTSKGY